VRLIDVSYAPIATKSRSAAKWRDVPGADQIELDNAL